MLGFLLVSERLRILRAYFSRHTMTNNKETPNSSSNSQNTSDSNWSEAHSLIRHNIQRDTSRALSKKNSSDAFIKRHLSSKKQAFEYVESLWNQIRESSKFSNTTVTDVSLMQLAQNLRREFVVQAEIFEKNRRDIGNLMFQEYSLNPDQKFAILQEISGISSTRLDSYFLASQRKQLLWNVCRNRNEDAPLTHKTAVWLRNTFGSAVDRFDAKALRALQSAEKNGRMSHAALENIWNQLDEQGQTNLLSLLSINISLQSLHELDSTTFSKETLKSLIRADIAKSISPELEKMFDNTEDTNLKQVLEHLEWSDISHLYLDGETITNLVQGSNRPFPRKLSLKFQEWLDEQTEVQELEKAFELRKSKISEQSENSESENDTLSEAWVANFRKQLSEHHKSASLHEDLLLNSEFLNGNMKLVITTLEMGKDDLFTLVEAGKDVQDDKGRTYGVWMTPITADGIPDYTQRRFIPMYRFIDLFDRQLHVGFEKDTDFFAKHGRKPLNDTVEVKDIDFTPVDTDSSGADIEDETTGTDDSIPNSLESFNAAASKKMGENISLSTRDCISIGKPGSDKYNVYRIQGFTETGIKFWNGSPAFPEEEISFSDLFKSGIQNETAAFKILENKLGTMGEFLGIMQSNSTQKEVWKELEVTRDDKENEIFDFVDRRFDSTKTKKQYFPGNDGKIVEIISIDNGMAHIRTGEKFEKSKKSSEASTAEWYQEQEVPLQYLVQYLTRFSCAPWNEPPREIGSREVPKEAKTEKGTIKSIFGRLSVHDLISGSKKFMEEFKHHLQHGNHLQEQRVMLGIAKQIGLESWNSEWYADFKSQYENGEKKLIEERLETLGKMGTPDRQKSIRASLLNNGTHDYDHWTNALSMLEKHGNLYAGGLQDLE